MIGSFTTFNYKLGSVKGKAIDINALLQQMRDLEKSYLNWKKEVDYKSSWIAFKDILFKLSGEKDDGQERYG